VTAVVATADAPGIADAQGIADQGIADARAQTRAVIARLYEPRSVAIVGAGTDPRSMGGRALSVLQERHFPGALYPVNPKRSEIAGLTCYASIGDIPGPVDVVELLIKTSATIAVIEEAAAKGAYAAILLNAGFAEMGPEGAAIQAEMSSLAARLGIRLIGPNCGGVMNVRRNIPLGFLPAFSLADYPVGQMGLVSQSGGVLTNLLNKVHDRRIGLSFAASTGNEPDLSWLDFLDFMVHDEGTRAIAVYAEGMPDGIRFMQVADDALRLGKPIVMLKGGSSRSGQAAAASHTAALATSQRVLEAVARRFAVTLVDDVDDLIDTTNYLASDSQSRGVPIVAVGTSGGMGVMTADALDHGGVPMAELADTTVEQLAGALPAFAILRNPIDMTGQYLNDPDLFKKAIDVLAGAPEIGAILFSFAMITEGYAEQFADEIVEVSKAIDKPITISWVGGSVTEGGVKRLREAGFPVFRRLGTAASAIRASGDFAVAHLAAGDVPARRAPAVGTPGITVPPGGLSEFEAEQLLALRGVPVVRAGLAGSAGEAVAIADGFGYPVVLKVSSVDIQHKSDVGGVRLGLASAEEVAAAYEDLAAIGRGAGTAATGGGDERGTVLVQEMAPRGLEMIVGLQRDPTYGWLVLVGTGGIYAEVAQDVVLRPAPVDAVEAALMLGELRGHPVLEGLRGRPRSDVSALADLVARVSRLSEDFGDQDLEVDLNPVLVYEDGHGVLAVDALIVPAARA
jgi:acyl-CoA synthetase (NDP forming)